MRFKYNNFMKVIEQNGGMCVFESERVSESYARAQPQRSF